MTGVEFLDAVYREAPEIIRILSTAYSDLTAAVDAVNRGQIYKYVTKPWDISTLEANLRRGMEFFLLKKERDQLVYASFFEDLSNEQGFYEGFKNKNSTRLTALVKECKEFLQPDEALTKLVAILNAKLSEDKASLKDVDLKKLTDIFQGLFGYTATNEQTELSKNVFHLLLSLAQSGKGLIYSGQTQTYEIQKISSSQDSIEYLLDDELLLARIGGAL